MLFFLVTLKNLSSKENDAGNGMSLPEEMEEDIKEIKNLVQKKRFRKKRKLKVLKLLDNLSAKAERCGGRKKRNQLLLIAIQSPIRPVMIKEI